MPSTPSCKAVLTICSGVWLKSTVDDFHTCIPESPGYHFDPPVMTVKTGLANNILIFLISFMNVNSKANFLKDSLFPIFSKRPHAWPR